MTAKKPNPTKMTTEFYSTQRYRADKTCLTRKCVQNKPLSKYELTGYPTSVIYCICFLFQAGFLAECLVEANARVVNRKFALKSSLRSAWTFYGA